MTHRGNPWHDERGRFCSGPVAKSISVNGKRRDISAEEDRDALKGFGERRGHLEFSTTRECVGQICKDMGCSEERAGEVLENIRHYSGNGHISLRKYQRGEISDAKMEKMDSDIEGYISAAPGWSDEAPLYRGMSSKRYDGVEEGDIIDMGGTSSWTSDKEVASRWHGRDTKVIFVCEDTGNINTASIDGFSKQKQKESEVLCTKKAFYRVKKKETSRISDLYDVVIVHVDAFSLGD